LSDAAGQERYINDHVQDIYRFLDKREKSDSSVRDVILKTASKAKAVATS
jgi:hypothetical protein